MSCPHVSLHLSLYKQASCSLSLSSLSLGERGSHGRVSHIVGVKCLTFEMSDTLPGTPVCCTAFCTCLRNKGLVAAYWPLADLVLLAHALCLLRKSTRPCLNLEIASSVRKFSMCVMSCVCVCVCVYVCICVSVSTQGRASKYATQLPGPVFTRHWNSLKF